MHQQSTAVLEKDIVTETVAYRDAALQYYSQFVDALTKAQEIHDQALEALRSACGGVSGLPVTPDKYSELEAFDRTVAPPLEAQHFNAVATQVVDLQVWASIFQRSGITNLMDSTAEEEFGEQLRYVPLNPNAKDRRLASETDSAEPLPPVSVDNVDSTLQRFAENAEQIWLRGIAVAFSTLDRRFRSHDGFKLGSRIILTSAFDQSGSWNYRRRHRETLRDIERVFMRLDGKKLEDGRESSFVQQINADRQKWSCHQSSHTGEYFRVNIYENGNAHLWFQRKDLVERINKLLAIYYGGTLGWGKEAPEDPGILVDESIDRPPAGNLGCIPTPEDLADRILEKARLAVARPLRILEPSAGIGRLAERAVSCTCESYPDPPTTTDHLVTVVEIQPSLANKLRQSKKYHEVLNCDFLQMEPEPTYDRVIMAPPFDSGQDVEHVYHALKFLRPGGNIVAIMNATSEFSTTETARAFREYLREHHGYCDDLPIGSYSESGANMNTLMLCLTKNVS